MKPHDKGSPPSKTLELTITDLAAGGRGVARHEDGRVVFVAGGLPGEKVTAGVVKDKRQYIEAKALKVADPSAQRITPPCPLYGDCGGCDLMHLAPAAQVEAKAGWVLRALNRLGEVPEPRLAASPINLAYRNRVRFQTGGGRMGFFGVQSRRLVQVKSCPIAAPAINRVLPDLAKAVAQAGSLGLTSVEALVGTMPDSDVYLTLHLARNVKLDRSRRDGLERLADQAGAAGARLSIDGRPEPWNPAPESGVEYFSGPPRMWAFPGVFCQVNFRANRLLVDAVLEAAATADQGRALDLYAGSGNFTFPMAASGQEVVSVEMSPSAHQAAVFHRGWLRMQDHVNLVRSDAAKTVAKLAEQGEDFGVAVLDPPRAGAKELMPALKELAPRRVVYVSCHAAALARDIRVLIEAGYHMSQLTVVDLFPQTGHVESVLVLDR